MEIFSALIFLNEFFLFMQYIYIVSQLSHGIVSFFWKVFKQLQLKSESSPFFFPGIFLIGECTWKGKHPSTDFYCLSLNQGGNILIGWFGNCFLFILVFLKFWRSNKISCISWTVGNCHVTRVRKNACIWIGIFCMTPRENIVLILVWCSNKK